jgi:hypothetical protein
MIEFYCFAITANVININVVFTNIMLSSNDTRKVIIAFIALVTLLVMTGFIIGAVSGFRERVAF